jgi:hypothetical protein
MTKPMLDEHPGKQDLMELAITVVQSPQLLSSNDHGNVAALEFVEDNVELVKKQKMEQSLTPISAEVEDQPRREP